MARYHEENKEIILQKAYAYNKEIGEKMRSEPLGDVVQHYYDLIEKITKESGMNDTITCGAGCGFCCHAEIPVNSFEAIYLKEVVSGLDIDEDALFIQLKADDYNSLDFKKRRCTLLDNDDKCRIYKNRPLVCRSHNSIDLKDYCNRVKYPTRKLNRAYNIDIEAIQMAFAMVSNNGSTELHKIL
ncbi:MAG: hypothetical protein DRQ39_10790 [Gammaproteobacteria bacterium]|nr:MAG: hypothetical protein DRQ39_10790 [Gammaproteobacteria bacterium]